MLASIKEFIAEPLRRANLERQQYLEECGELGLDWRPAMVLVATAVLLTARYYQPNLETTLEVLRCIGERHVWTFPSRLIELIEAPHNGALAVHIHWALWQCLTYVAVPMLVVKLLFRERLADYGVKLRGMTSGLPVYAGMYLGLLPLVLVVSTTASFQHTYPFLKPTAAPAPAAGERQAEIDRKGQEQELRAADEVIADEMNASQINAAEGNPAIDAATEPRIDPRYWPRFWTWQVFYALQFVSLEFFFRGFMLHGLRRSLGAYAIFAMTVPYCMIHFGKPLPETLAAIVAGVLLGFMSLKTRSIWLGSALHIAVAMTMDAAALAQWSAP